VVESSWGPRRRPVQAVHGLDAETFTIVIPPNITRYALISDIALHTLPSKMQSGRWNRA
jgi:hypothetical protein